MSRVRRIATVTLALSALGGFVGAALGAAVLALGVGVALASGGPDAPDRLGRLLLAGAAAGGVCGLGLAPLVWWSLLRRVPLRRAIVVTAAGTLAGALAGSVLGLANPFQFGAVPAAALGVVGFFVAAAGLRAGHSPSRGREGEVSAPAAERNAAADRA
jgi:hypothetical protein